LGSKTSLPPKEDEMATAFVQHKVRDYGAWREVYDSVGDLQKQGGVTEEAVYRSEDDPTTVLVMHRFSSADQARAFFENPDLRDAMGRAGVDSASLRVEFYEES
jgi:heme-degrading monooxygenase HmoA